MNFMVLLIYLVALFGIATNGSVDESGAEYGVDEFGSEFALGAMDPQKKAILLELYKKCKAVEGMSADKAKAAQQLTDQQLQSCPKITQKVDAAKAKAGLAKAGTQGAGAKPAVTQGAGVKPAVTKAATQGAGTKPGAAQPATQAQAQQQNVQAGAKPAANTQATDAAKTAKIQKLLAACKAKKGTLSPTAQAKCDKLEQNAQKAGVKPSPQAAQKTTSPGAVSSTQVPQPEVKPAVSTTQELKQTTSPGAVSSTQAPQPEVKPAVSTTQEPKQTTVPNSGDASTNQQAQQTAAQKLKEANEKLKKAQELNKLSSQTQGGSTAEPKKVDPKKVSDDFKKEQKKMMRRAEKIAEQDTERISSGCFKKDVYYDTKDLYYFTGVESSFRCQLKCGKLDGCLSFSWYNKDAVTEGKKTPKVCLLKGKVPSEDTRRENAISGPKFCGKGMQKEFEEGNEEKLQPLPASLIYTALSPRVVILGSFAIFAFGLVVSRTLCYTRKKNSTACDNSSDLLEDTEI